MQRLLKPSEVQEVLGLGKSAVYAMLASGEIQAVVVTGSKRRKSYRVRPAALEKFINEREVA